MDGHRQPLDGLIILADRVAALASSDPFQAGVLGEQRRYHLVIDVAAAIDVLARYPVASKTVPRFQPLDFLDVEQFLDFPLQRSGAAHAPPLTRNGCGPAGGGAATKRTALMISPS